jgi:hypothetical protein
VPCTDQERSSPTWPWPWLGGDCLADIAVLRSQPGLFGPVASDLVVSRLVTRLAADAPRVLKARRTHDFLAWLTRPGRRLAYSVELTNSYDIQDAILAGAWTSAYDSDRQVRDGAWVAELTGVLDLSSWPKSMRVMMRKERPHLGAT